MRVFLLVLAFLSACGPLTPIRVDGGASAGGVSGTGGGLNFGGGSGTGGGQSTGGGSAGGGNIAGASAGGGNIAGTAFSWESMSLIPSPGSVADGVSVSARVGEVWLTVASKLFRSTGGAFNQVSLSPGSTQHVLVTPGGKVFVGGVGLWKYCTSTDCSVPSNFVTAPDLGLDEIEGLCNSAEKVYGFGVNSGRRALLFEFNGTGWIKVSNDLGFYNPKQCVVGPAGEVYVLGSEFVVRYEAGSFRQENVNLMGQPSATWNDMAFTFGPGGSVEGMLVGTATSRYAYARRDAAGGGWTTVAPAMVGRHLRTVVTVGPHEYLAAGDPGGSTSSRFMTWNGTTWVASTNQPPNALIEVLAASASSAREVFLAGSGAAGVVVIRGRR
jgi:hypothetical protein